MEEDLAHVIKLANAIPLTIFVLFLVFLVSVFESSLEAGFSDITTVKLSLEVEGEGDEHDEEEVEDNKIAAETVTASKLLFESIDYVENIKIDYLESTVLSNLNDKEKLIAIALVVKKLRKNKRYEQSLALIIELDQKNQEQLGLIFSKAFNLAKLGHKDAAVISYEHLLNLEPRNHAANINLGMLYLSLKDYTNAEKIFLFGIASTAGIKKSKNIYGLASVYLETLRYNKALLSFKKAIEYRPDHGLFWKKLANVAIIVGDHKLANDSYQKSISLDSDNLARRLEFAEYLFRRLDFVGAIKQLLRAKTLDRDSFSVRLKLLLAYLNANKPINAKKQLALAKNTIQLPSEKLRSEAVQLYLNKNYLEAIGVLKKNIKTTTNIDLENYLIAKCYLALKRRIDAKKYLDRLSEDSKYFSIGQYLLAEAYIDSGQTQESIALFQDLVLRLDDNPRVFLQAAKAHQIAGDFETAIKMVNEAISIKESKQLLLRRADLWWLSGRQGKSTDALESIVTQYPNYLRARYHLADYNHKIGNNPAAISAYLELLDIRTSYGDAQYQLGLVYFEQRRFEDSLPLLRDYLLEKPDSKRTRLLYARAFCELGQSLECKEQLKLVIKLAPNYVPALELLNKQKVSHP